MKNKKTYNSGADLFDLEIAHFLWELECQYEYYKMQFRDGKKRILSGSYSKGQSE